MTTLSNNITRRKLLSGISAILATSTAPAYITKSLLGAKEISISDIPQSWDNPYITDGLVALWDGEWNAGVGLHDYYITDWVDLTGNRKSFHADSPVWGENFCMCDGTFASCFHCLSAEKSEWFFDLLSTGVYTIEFLMEKGSNRVSSTFFTCGLNNTYTPGLYTRYAAVNETKAGFYMWMKGGYSGELYLPGTYYTNTKLYDLSCDGTSCHMFLHGEGKEANGDIPASTAIDIDTSGGKGNLFRYAFFCRGDGYAASSAQGLKLYRLAIYDKALSADEIAYNYSIDQLRFNLT